MTKLSRIRSMDFIDNIYCFRKTLSVQVDDEWFAADINTIMHFNVETYQHGFEVGNVVANLRAFCDLLEKKYTKEYGQE